AATGTGSVWTWIALDAETKLVPSWLIGGRDAGAAHRFVSDLRDRLANRVQLTSDGLHAYLETVGQCFCYDIDYAILMKLYGPDGNPKKPESKYSPGRCNGSRRQTIVGNPDKEHVSTSYVERQNLTMRMSMRRFTRLTNAFSKKVENLGHAVALHFMHYNYCRKHQTTNMTPAQAAGVADHQWSVEEIIGLLDKTDSN
ncbi:MAG: IS1 family transposase, partial [Planctomycetes bacterium]|nr:IS1 family transposase [Planctomycetota bacterium]